MKERYDFYDNLEKKFFQMYSTTGKVERSVAQNIGKIINVNWQEKTYYQNIDKFFGDIEKRFLRGTI